MWVIGKIRECVESIHLELNRHMGNSEDDVFFQPKSSLSQSVHSNIITPDNIPRFCLPPRLCKRSPPPEDQPNPSSQNPKSSTSSAAAQSKMKDMEPKKEDATEPWKVSKKPLPFSAEGYGLAGIYESPNTRRKESLFHSEAPEFMFERSIAATASGDAKEKTHPRKPFLGFSHCSHAKAFQKRATQKVGLLPLVNLCLSVSPSIKPSNPTTSGHLKETKSCPSLLNSYSLASPCSTPTTDRDSFLSPPVLPLDTLQCQERLQLEHVLPLQGRGTVQLSAEQSAFSGNTLCTVRVRLVCVEGLSNEVDRQALNCTVSLCLTPGKLQQQESATVRNCRRPVFNEDFFFTELRHQDLQELQLRLKVVTKPAAGTLRRGRVIGTVNKPLTQLLPVQKHT